MQLGNSSQTQQPDSASQQLFDTLQDIVSNVQIHSNFCISHPNYKPFELPDEVVARFQQMPVDIQNKYFGLQLRSFLYGIYYNGSMRASLAPDADSAGLALHQDLENNTRLGVDIAFYEKLHSCNRGRGYFDPGWCVVRLESDGTLAVTKDGLTLHIEPEKHLQLAEQSAVVGELVAIRMPRNFVQSGFYMAVSNVGRRTYTHPNREPQPQIVRIYFNFSPEGAAAVMDSLTRQLNDVFIPFTFKTLYNPGEYKRYDSGVLYFEKSNYKAVRQVLESVYALSKAHFHTDIPLFTKFLAPGLGLAEEPDSKFAEQESFGMNRCQIIANGLLEAWHSLDDSAERRMTFILKQFSLLGVELLRSYLNANSVDIYTPLNL
ncbi:MAG: T3SS effector HopA1 family protein [Rhizonema sp. NSF051]|nr:T3SS effector HopA1 family protein [Rhizonema sp. NSF051]